MVGLAGRLAGQSAEVAHAAFVRAYAPQTASGDIVDRAIGNWLAQHAKVARLLAQVCAGDDAPCVHFRTLDAQMLSVAASARTGAGAPVADRSAALGRLPGLHSD